MSQHDYDFGFGPGRHLRGSGWKGILALCVVLATMVLISTEYGPRAVARGADLLQMIHK